jgi:hypothetical protein
MPRPPKPAGTTADQVLAVRLTTADHALVGELVAHHRTELSKLHVAGSVTPADLIRTLLRREAERVGLRKTEPGAQPTPVPLTPEPPPPPSPESGDETPELPLRTPRAKTSKTAKPKAGRPAKKKSLDRGHR